MAVITLRSIKGSPLTITEVDNNFSNLNIEVGTKLDTTSYTAADILTKLKTVDTDDSGLNASTLKGLIPATANTASTLVSRDASGNFAAGIITASLIGSVTGNVTGNVTGTVTNGVVTSALYSDPSWITALSAVKVGLGNVTNESKSTMFTNAALTGIPTAPTAALSTNTTQIATTAFVTAALAVIYPVGSVYTSTVSSNPNSLFGFGTWVAFGAGRVLIGNGSGFTAGATGGSADAVVVSHSHSASVSDPGHAHGGRVATSLGGYQGQSGFEEGRGQPDWATQNGTSAASTGISVSISTNGVSGANANLQPYVVVYMWQRTA